MNRLKQAGAAEKSRSSSGGGKTPRRNGGTKLINDERGEKNTEKNNEKNKDIIGLHRRSRERNSGAACRRRRTAFANSFISCVSLILAWKGTYEYTSWESLPLPLCPSLSVCLSLYLFLSICLSVCLSVGFCLFGVAYTQIVLPQSSYQHLYKNRSRRIHISLVKLTAFLRVD